MLFKKKLKKRYKEAGEIYKEFIKHTDWCVESITEFLNSIPDADVEEVKHGEWITRKSIHREEFYVCSVCKTATDDIWRYCPHCGANMDER